MIRASEKRVSLKVRCDIRFWPFNQFIFVSSCALKILLRISVMDQFSRMTIWNATWIACSPKWEWRRLTEMLIWLPFTNHSTRIMKSICYSFIWCDCVFIRAAAMTARKHIQCTNAGKKEIQRYGIRWKVNAMSFNWAIAQIFLVSL